MECWYVVQTKPNKARQVEARLLEHGVQVYYPTVPAPRRWQSRLAERPLFRWYLFARADLDAVGL